MHEERTTAMVQRTVLLIVSTLVQSDYRTASLRDRSHLATLLIRVKENRVAIESNVLNEL